MSIVNVIWLVINIILILLILIRSPNEQSFQETIGPLKLFDSTGSAEKNIDQLIQLLVVLYFVLGFIMISNAF